MRLLDKYQTVEEVGTYERHRYNQNARMYCHERANRAQTRDYELFWSNMHYIYCLMLEKNPQRYL